MREDGMMAILLRIMGYVEVVKLRRVVQVNSLRPSITFENQPVPLSSVSRRVISLYRHHCKTAPMVTYHPGSHFADLSGTDEDDPARVPADFLKSNDDIAHIAELAHLPSCSIRSATSKIR